MVVFLLGEENKIGEIVELQEEWIKVQLYGSTSSKSLSLDRWKFYPGWEKESGDVEFKKVVNMSQKPAVVSVKSEQIKLVFRKLNLNATLPETAIARMKL